MTGWETFSGGRLGAAFTNPAVTITPERQFHLNTGATRLLRGAPRVELLWDAEERCIGLRAADAATLGSYALTPYSKGTARQVSGNAFLRHYGLLELCGKRFPAHMEGDVLVVPLAPATDAGPAVES